MTPGELKEARKKEKREARKINHKPKTKFPKDWNAFFNLAKDFRFSLDHLKKKPK